MYRYVVQRLLQGIIVMFLVSIATFGILQAAPGSPIDTMLGEGATQLTQEDYDRILEKWGLDKPWYVQYFTWLRNFATGDFGDSVVRAGVPVHEMVLEAAWPTVQLNVLALAAAIALAIPAGMFAAIRRYSIFDSAIMVWASAGVALPNFWVGLMLIILLALYLGWLPPSGPGDWKHYVMPVFVLAINETAILARLMRGAMLEVLGQDYITTARAKGLSEIVVIVRHAVRNALLPIITVIGLRAAFLLSGTVVVETIFAWPGIGRLFYDSVFRSDYQVVQAIVMLFTVLVILANILTDLTYALIDPRIRLK
ncbi:MAG TPA: ABC transporter permease [Thermomicrobiales bacterium]|nr:ABC transporter permease [Thermomicrobiales bacterium]